MSELTRPRPDPGVVGWVAEQEERSLHLSVLTLGEIEKGIGKLADSERKAKLRLWLEHELCHRFAGRILDITKEVALTWGRLQAQAESRGRKLPVVDGLIAATAVTHGLAVVTRNTVDLAASGAALVNPWRS